MGAMKQAERHLLVVEDDRDAAFLIQRVLEKADAKCIVKILADGAQAIDYLAEKIKGPPSSIPFVVVTDLKMPKKTGFDVISWVRNEPRLAELPVVVLSASKEQSDIDRAMSLGATAFIEKPLEISELLEIARSILEGKPVYQSKR